MNDPTTLAQALRQFRGDAGLSLRDLAERSGINRGAISRLESGERVQPRAETLKRLAAALGIPTEDLYAAAGWKVPNELPSFKPYLRTKYGHLPSDKLTELEAIFQEISQRDSENKDQDKNKDKN